MSDESRIHIHTTFRDVLALNFWANVTLKINWVMPVLLAALLTLGVGIKVPVEDVSLKLLQLLTVFLASFAAIVWFMVPVILCSALANVFMKGVLGTKTVMVDAKGLKEDDGHCERFFAWQDVRRCLLTNDYIFVQVTRFKYLTIPRRDFTSEYAFACYYAQLLKYRASIVAMAEPQ